MDYNEWLSYKPYSWSQAEKEERYLTYFKELTEFHRKHCPSYGRMLDLLGYRADQVASLAQIPFLPIPLFKQQNLKSIAEEAVFKTITSSGTSGSVSRIFLDAATAQNQQLTLNAIVQEFIASSRLPMLIIDAPSVLTDREKFTARGAAILGFSMFAKRRYYALSDDLTIDITSLRSFAETYAGKPVLLFGFTFMVWKYFYEALQGQNLRFDFSQAILIHGGGWKKLQQEAVSPAEYKRCLQAEFGITRIHNYYGMAEQTGSIYMECEYGHLHASIFSEILVRNHLDFSLCPVGKAGILQVLSPIARSYPGHSLLTEDVGRLLGIDDCPCGRKGKYFSVDGRIPSAEIRGCSDTYGQ
ncbi:MAG: acyl-protein synthetase [Sporomusaceae bacterium]|nr:acyl-protein synthetase [Sporomusaceae bacterium]